MTSLSPTPSRRAPALSTVHPVPVYAFASPVYWPDPEERRTAADRLEAALRSAWPDLPEDGLTFHLIDTEEAARAAAPSGLALFVPMSGGTQPWMLHLAEQIAHVALVNAYLPGAVSEDLGHTLMHRNAHPACTDFYAYRRRSGAGAYWMRRVEDVPALWRAWQAAQRLRAARLLQIGETEPWVINSCRSPERIREQLGTEVVPIAPEVLYERVRAVADAAVQDRAQKWVEGAGALVGVTPPDVVDACRVVHAMETLLEQHEADGLAMACFAMIQDLDTTSCLALSMLNEAADRIGACEGDLDAALTLVLLKALGADFIWIANPILHAADYLDLVHCTAPRCACQIQLPYRLLRHHESGRGVAPEVELPGEETVTLTRLGNEVRDLVVHRGTTERRPKQPACHTQIRVHVPSVQHVLDTLLGTHLVMSYGDFTAELHYAAGFLGLRRL